MMVNFQTKHNMGINIFIPLVEL